MARQSRWVLVPFLFAAFPALSFLARNLGQVQPADLLRPLVASLAFALVVLVLMRLLFRDPGRAAAAATLLILVAFSYGHLYDGLKAVGLSGATIVRHRYLLPAVILVVVLVLVAIRRSHFGISWATVLTAVGVVAVLSPTVQVAGYYGPLALWRFQEQARASQCDLPAPPSRPDVYLIILDAYEREDVLRDVRGYDNSWFVGQLEDMGFYVSPGSLSNYSATRLSLASVLNSTYVQDFQDEFGAGPSLIWLLSEKISDNETRHVLECLGYRTVAFETGVFWTEWRDADTYLERPDSDSQGLLRRDLSRPELTFLNTTILRPVLDAGAADSQSRGLAEDPRTDHRNRILFVLDQLGDVASLPSPKLVFAHIVAPHPPYVFGAGGEDVRQGQFETPPSEAAGDAYTNQVAYLNGRVVDALRQILRDSAVPPVIVIMGDHGWTEQTHETRMAILNAYHLPGGPDGLYPTITPVNSFRLILDRVFGTSLGLLPDRSYLSSPGRTFDFIPVPNTWTPDSTQPADMP